MSQHLVIIDALNLIRRLYAVQERQVANPQQLIIATESSLRNACNKLLRRLKPSHVVAVFDGEHLNSTWRHQLYPDYKRSRKPMPQALAEAIPTLQDLLLSLGIDSLRSDQHEADDICATLASKARQAAFPVTVISTDQGYYPLLAEGVAIHDYFKNLFITVEQVENKFELPLARIKDYWAMVGSSSVDVKGVAGIGPKTAKKIINDFADLEQAITSQSDEKSLVKLKQQADELRLAKQLLSPKTDLELGFKLSQLRYQAG